MGPPRTPAERRAARSVVARDHIDRYTRLAEHSAEDARFVVYAVERDASDGIHTQPLVVWLENAIKYSDDGDIHLRIGVGEHEGRPMAILSVRDEGIGLDPSDLDRIFDRFVQAASGPVRGHAGLGLGLYVARQIARAHQGDVWAESPGRGRGSTFFLRLPLESGQAL